jgi:K+-sensing histidine kinase KdpD
LIENAVKYAGDMAKIRVEVCRQNDGFLFQVIDNGPGIPEAERQRIFESFYRVDDSLARLTSGAGLGLAICQGLVRAHGGQIWSELRDVGACIAFTIPVSKATAPNTQKKARKPLRS